jgi:Tol biopolymer transport system component
VLVIRSAGSAAKRVYSLKGSAPSLSSLGWAPDSRHLAFLTNGKLVLLDTVSRRARTVHAKDYDTIDSFRFSPDSREILYSVVRQIYIYALSWNGWPGYNPFSTRAYVVATTGGKPHRIGGKTATIGMFSPDSSKIVYASGGNIYVVPVRGGEAVRLTHEHRDSNPVWGKPGIAFLRGGRRGKLGDIWISDGTRRRPRQLTHAGAGMTPVMFSAKGNELLASNGGLWSVGSHWGGCAFCPAVVPVHTLIAPQSFVIQERVWAVDARTGAARRIPPLGRGVRARGISADGHTVLASVDCSAPHGYVETVPLRRGKPHVIARGSCDSSWSAGPQLPR